ncbi:MAG: nuclear transport factor 2 family protein [Pseudomonadota bacterium]|nr:nuclear transport factor 2 family protein [Pseudomonadota bacterium]
MLKSRSFINFLFFVSVFAGQSISAQVENQPGLIPLSGTDYEEIRELYARYNQGSDFRDAELFLSAFAEDAIMTREGRDIVGMASLRADRERRYQGETGDVGRRHVNGSFIIQPTKEGASSQAYYILLDVTTRPPTMIGSGYYEDTFVRTPLGWRIKHRKLFIDGDGNANR